jgi:pimeloyl-ACP methyl ester carboxylesterase
MASRACASIVPQVLRLAIALAMLLICMLPSPGVAQPGSAGATPNRPLVFIPGLLGSRLCRPNPANPSEPTVVWGTLGAVFSFPTLRLVHAAGAKADDVKPCGLLREVAYLGVFTQEVYGPIIRHLEQVGYREGRDLFVFDYDWRRSVFDNAQALDDFVRARVPDAGRRVDILAHSLGGLVARVYAVKLGGSARIGRLMSAGTPFLGSVKVFESVEEGWGVANHLLGGIAAFRRNMLSFPSIFELAARYGACCDGVVTGTPAFAVFDAKAWRALGWEGVDPADMPDLAAASERVRELATIVGTPLPAGVEEVMLLGVDQRTPHRFGLEQRGGTATVRMRTTWEGDGTVPRESATIARATVYSTSFADHERILQDPQVNEFVGVTLTRGTAEAVRVVPVRPRLRVRTADGTVTQLVGVAVVPDQPMYRAGDAGRAHVHVRLDSQQPLPVEALRLVLRMPDGRETPIALRRDPAGSDPSNPFEQSFVGEFQAGAGEGTRTLRATVAAAGTPPRIVERPVPVISR